jgi:hypothetical protein
MVRHWPNSGFALVCACNETVKMQSEKRVVKIFMS